MVFVERIEVRDEKGQVEGTYYLVYSVNEGARSPDERSLDEVMNEGGFDLTELTYDLKGSKRYNFNPRKRN